MSEPKKRGRRPLSNAARADAAVEAATGFVKALIAENLWLFGQLADDAEIRRENGRLLLENDKLRATLAETTLERDALAAHLMRSQKSNA